MQNARKLGELESALFAANGRHVYALDLQPWNVRLDMSWDAKKKVLQENLRER